MKLSACTMLVVVSLMFPRAAMADEVVVLLHGIANIPLSMKYLENSLEKEGYRVHNLGYPSTDVPIEEAAGRIREKVMAISGFERIHFVGHSMGNLLIRLVLADDTPGLGRVVMIAPPNHGSFMAQRLEDLDITGGSSGRPVSSYLLITVLFSRTCPSRTVNSGSSPGEGEQKMATTPSSKVTMTVRSAWRKRSFQGLPILRW